MSNPVRVLLVDDHQAIRASAASILGSSCIVTGVVGDGRTAIEAAAILKPDVIVIDISLPGMTGIEVATELRKTGSTAALVFLSVYDDEELILASRESGAIGYVVKDRIASDLELAVHEAHAGRSFTSPIR